MLLPSKESQEPGTGWKLYDPGTGMGIIFDPGPGGDIQKIQAQEYKKRELSALFLLMKIC